MIFVLLLLVSNAEIFESAKIQPKVPDKFLIPCGEVFEETILCNTVSQENILADEGLIEIVEILLCIFFLICIIYMLIHLYYYYYRI